MTLEEVEKRIKVLEDLDEIKNLHREYIDWLNLKDADKLTDCFAEDATADIRVYGPKKGREEISKLFHDIIGPIQVVPGSLTPKGGHFVYHPIISVDGNKAKGQWLLDRLFDDMRSPDGPVLMLTKGKYDCEYVREKGRWKFSYLKWTHPWPPEG